MERCDRNSLLGEYRVRRQVLRVKGKDTTKYGCPGKGTSRALIHSCVKNNDAVRIIDPNGTCESTETALDWSTTAGGDDIGADCTAPPNIGPGVDLVNGNLHGGILSGANLTNSNLSSADLMIGVWSKTTCPDELSSKFKNGVCP